MLTLRMSDACRYTLIRKIHRYLHICTHVCICQYMYLYPSIYSHILESICEKYVWIYISPGRCQKIKQQKSWSIHTHMCVYVSICQVNVCTLCIYSALDIEWRRCIEWLLCIGQFLQKSLTIHHFFSKSDLRLTASYASSPPCSSAENMVLTADADIYVYVYVIMYIYLWFLFMMYLYLQIKNK